MVSIVFRAELTAVDEPAACHSPSQQQLLAMPRHTWGYHEVPMRSAGSWVANGPDDPRLKNPITGIVGCCARAPADSRGAAPERDEFAALHSITSSASASRRSGTASPSALAVLRLSTKSNFVGCITGRSAGLSPLRTLPT